MCQPIRPAAGPSGDFDRDLDRLDENRAERLLSGALPVGPVPESIVQVVALVAALRVPASVRELAGESAAVARFRAASAHASTSRSRRRSPRLVAKLSVKTLLAVALGLASGGGIAAAAATDHLPGLAQRIVDRVVGRDDGPAPVRAPERGPANGQVSAPSAGDQPVSSPAPTGTSSSALATDEGPATEGQYTDDGIGPKAQSPYAQQPEHARTTGGRENSELHDPQGRPDSSGESSDAKKEL